MAGQSRTVPCEACRQKKLVCKMMDHNGAMQCERCIHKQLVCSGPRRTDAYIERRAKKGSDNSKRRPIAPTVDIPHNSYDSNHHVSPGFGSSPLSPASYSSLSPSATFVPTQQSPYSSNYPMPYSHSVPYHLPQQQPQQDHFTTSSNAVPHSSVQRFGEPYSRQAQYTADATMYLPGYDLNSHVCSGSFYSR